MKTLRDIDVKDKVVLVRTDYNVPLAQDAMGEWRVASDLRILASLPTLRYLLEYDAKKIIVISHLGRPKGEEESLSLKPVAAYLGEILDMRNRPDQSGDDSIVAQSISFVNRISGEEVKKAVQEMPDGGILVLENLRFDPREKENSLEFAKEIVDATGAEIFVQDGFAVMHRAHTSTDAITKILPSVAGLLVEGETKLLKEVMENPEKPLVVIIGGAKVEDKMPLIEKFLPIADKILVGGKIAADGFKSDNPKIYVAEDFDEDSEGNKLDIGPVATGKFIEALSGAKTVLWNGALGKVEDMAFATSTEMVAKFLGEHPEIKTVICGGDTAGFVQEMADMDPELKFDLISTGGGASLTLLTGGEMPGLLALKA